MKGRILIVYTGGTIGMKHDYGRNVLTPVDFAHVVNEVPELARLDCDISVKAFEKPLDSSDMDQSVWLRLVSIIEENYNSFDGFVILHGSDTMAYTASALSFLLENLSKPVVLTGSQLPIGTLRTDGKENLITAIEIASARIDGRARVPEVAIYFEYHLYRGNRARKVDAEHFSAFETLNYPLLAEAGVSIKYNDAAIMKAPAGNDFHAHKAMSGDVAILKIFPGIRAENILAMKTIKNLRGLVMETYGSGNAPSESKVLKAVEELVKSGIHVLNITQCHGGAVNQSRYPNGRSLGEIGVVGGGDMTTEAGLTKLMFLLASGKNHSEIAKSLASPLRGEKSPIL